MALEARLDPTCLPIPEYHVAVAIPRREPPWLELISITRTKTGNKAGRDYQGVGGEGDKELGIIVPSIRRKPNLAGIPRHRVSGEPLLSILTEVIRVIDQDLVIK